MRIVRCLVCKLEFKTAAIVGIDPRYCSGACRSEASQKRRRRYEANPDLFKERSQRWRKDNLERKRHADSEYRKTHREQRKEQKRRYFKTHPEKRRESRRRWLERIKADPTRLSKMKESHRKYMRRYYHAHPERRHEVYLRQKAAHPERMRAQSRKRHYQLMAAVRVVRELIGPYRVTNRNKTLAKHILEQVSGEQNHDNAIS